jgi:enterochelin esterase-like enzyme
VSATITRRQALFGAGAGTIAVAGTGVELVSRGVLPGKHLLDELDGACSVSTPLQTTVTAGPQRSGSFYSRARARSVGYTIAYPPGHAIGDRLPLALVLHGFGGDHSSGYGGLPLAQALASNLRGRTRRPIALVAADGGPHYWNAYRGDDPMTMLTGELIPLCRRIGLGGSERSRVGVTGTSMGGYGALLLAEHHPDLIAAAAAISPAVWTGYGDARNSNPAAYASAGAFASADVVAHTSALREVAVRVAAGSSDPFFGGVEALARVLPRSATVVLRGGCHDGTFFSSQRSASLDFVAEHIFG